MEPAIYSGRFRLIWNYWSHNGEMASLTLPLPHPNPRTCIHLPILLPALQPPDVFLIPHSW